MPMQLFVMRKIGVEDKGKGGRTLFVGIGEDAVQAAGYTALESGDPVEGENFQVVKTVSLTAPAANYGSIAALIERLQAVFALMGDAQNGWDDFLNDLAKLVSGATCDALGE